MLYYMKECLMVRNGPIFDLHFKWENVHNPTRSYNYNYMLIYL